MVPSGQRPRRPRTAAARAARLSSRLGRPKPVHFAPPARRRPLPACPAALPLAAVGPHANEPLSEAGRAGYSPVWTSPPPAAASRAREGPRRTPPGPNALLLGSPCYPSRCRPSAFLTYQP